MYKGQVLQAADRIRGYMSLDELELMWNFTYAFKNDTEYHLRFAEIGSYHGRSTFLLAHALEERGELHAVDPHEGELINADGGVVKVGDTLSHFKKNIEGLNNIIVHVTTSEVFNKWSQSLSFDAMLIDGLHDYESVRRDLEMFGPKCNYLMVHDYADGWPGVVAAVNELIQGGTYEMQTRAGSLVVLRRLDG